MPGMTPADVRERFEHYTERLLQSVSGRDDVIGLVLLGSTADTSRVDQWSDHDFFLIVAPGHEESYRTDLSWLPDRSRVSFAVRETAHGLKVVYDDGAVLEFAVASITDAAGFGGSPRRVVLDRGGVAEALEGGRGVPEASDDLIDFRLFLSLVLIGVGRARRGEELAGGQLVRTYAAERLIGLLRRHPPPNNRGNAEGTSEAAADPYNPWRRFEAAHPRLGSALGDAMAQRCEPCGLQLLDIADAHLRAQWPRYPEGEVATVRRALELRRAP